MPCAAPGYGVTLLDPLSPATLTGDEIKQLLDSGKIDRPDAPTGPLRPVTTVGSAIPKAGRRFGGAGEAAPQGA